MFRSSVRNAGADAAIRRPDRLRVATGFHERFAQMNQVALRTELARAADVRRRDTSGAERMAPATST